MGMTNDGRPLAYPDNPLTRAINSPPTSTRGGISAMPPPSVRSMAWGQPSPLSDSEKQELDARLEELDNPKPQLDFPEVKNFYALSALAPPKKAQVNFNNIQRIDLEREVIVVDDVEFPLAPDDVKQLRLLCVDCVLNAVVQGLREMLGQSGFESSQLLRALKEDVLGRRQEAAPLPNGPGVPGTGEGAEDTMEEGA